MPVAPELKSFIAWNGLDLRIKSVHKKWSGQFLLNPDDDDAEDQEDADPDGAGDQPELDRHVALHAPAPTHDVSHGLAGTSAGEVPD